MSYYLARLIVQLVIKLVTKAKLVGYENLPPKGQAYVIASNHLGRLDPVLVYYFLDRRDVTLMVAEKYQKYWFWRWAVRALDSIFVDRFHADMNAVRICLKRLKKGGVLALAPEGTRSPTGALIEGKPGTSFLAVKSGVPIVPAGVSGTEDVKILDGLRKLRRSEVTVRVGKSFTLPSSNHDDREDALKQATDEIMCQIAALLPPETRGVYADHPRLKELLELSENGNEAKE